VALDFHAVFAGIGMGRPKNQQQGVIQDFAGAGMDGLAMDKSAGRAFRRGRYRAAENLIGKGERSASGYADDGDGASAGGGGNRGDGIDWMRQGHVGGLIHPKAANRNHGSGEKPAGAYLRFGAPSPQHRET